MDLGIIIDIAEIIIQKYRSIKTMHKECEQAKRVAETVIEVVRKLQSELRQRRQDRTPPDGIRGPVNRLKEGVEEINKVITICRDKPLKAKVLSNTYIAKLRSATSKINDAMNALGGANAAISLQIQRELQTVSGALGSIQDLPAEVAREVRDAIRSEIKLLPFMLQNGLATDVEDAKEQLAELQEQLAELQEEKNELLSEKLLIDRDLIQMVCNLSIAELAQQQPTTQFQDLEVPASFKCPLSLEIMEDPVYLHTESGHSFERSMLVKALDRNPYQDPMTGLRYEHKLTFGPNRSLKDAIEEWKQSNYHSASAQRPPPPPHRIPEPPRRPITPPPITSQGAQITNIIRPTQSSAVQNGRPPEHLLSRWEWLRKLADNDRSLTRLDLDSKNIGGEGAKALATALGTNTSLQLLQLGDNKIGDEGAIAIANALGTNTSLQTLWLHYNNIGNEGAKAIATALATNTSLQELGLNNNKIGAEGAIAIGTALGTNTSLKKLWLDSNNIGNEGAKALATALGTNTSLQWLRLAENNIGGEGAKALATALGTNTSLQLLQLGHNKIGAKGAIAIANALGTNTSLKKLYLHGNNIGDEGAIAIGRGLGTNTSLQGLWLQYNNIKEGNLFFSSAKSKLKKIAKQKN